MSLIPALPIEMKNIENGYTRSSSTRRLRPRKIPITGYSRGGKGNSLLLSRYSPSSRRSLRSIDRSLRLFFESNHSRNNRKRRIGQDRVGKRTLPLTTSAPLEAAACRALGPTLLLHRISICRTLPRAADGKCYRQCVSETTH